jgi:uncharacterized membrane protein
LPHLPFIWLSGVALIADIGLGAYTVYAFFFNIAYDKWFPIKARS